jgi:hypothetical protein
MAAPVVFDRSRSGRSMSLNVPGERIAETSRGRPEDGFLGLLRALALFAVIAGAVGTVVMLLRAGQRTPRLLLVIFIVWVLSPFVALGWANVVSKRWSVLTRATLYSVTLLLTLGTPVIYADVIPLRRPGSANALLFVVVPPASWMLMTIVVSIAALVSRTLSRRKTS